MNVKRVLIAIVIGGALLYTIVKAADDRPPFYIDGKAVVMIDYKATEKDWQDAYLQWKAMRALDEYNAK
jgi:hypothetical protein